MTFTKEQKKEAYKKLSPEMQSLVMDPETTDLISSYLKEADLLPEHIDPADSEILYAMYGLQTLSDATNNIASLINKKAGDLSTLKTKLENSIFNKLQINKIDKSTENRVGEIAKKYSLDNIQTEKLIAIVNTTQTKDFAEILPTIIDELGISSLLAEQIMSDLENRVFDYALKQVEGAKIKVENKPLENVPQTQKPTLPVKNPVVNLKIPEIKPNNLPVGIIMQKSEPLQKSSAQNYNSGYKPQGVGSPEKNTVTQKTPETSRINYIPKTPESVRATDLLNQSSPKVGSEPVQRPVSVPRFTAIPIDSSQQIVSSSKETTPKASSPNEDARPTDSTNQFRQNSPKITPENVIINKLNNVTTSSTGSVSSALDSINSPQASPGAPPIEKKYSNDPYREPLE